MRLPDWLTRRLARRRQTTWVYCPWCRNDLVSCSRSKWVESHNFLQYFCGKCGSPSTWDFDTFPVPIHIRYHERTYA